MTRPADSLTETWHMYYTASWQSIEERLGTSPNSAPAERQFVWGLRYIDDCLLRDRDANNDGNFDERLYSQQDANWIVTAIVNESGAVQERYAYAAYGQPMFLTPTFADRASSSYTWESLYCGYRYESATGVFHVRNRVYHPVLGIWVQRDPLGYVDGMGLLRYSVSRPVTLIDSNGLKCDCPGGDWTVAGWNAGGSVVFGADVFRGVAHCKKGRLRNVIEYDCDGVVFTRKQVCFCWANITSSTFSVGFQGGASCQFQYGGMSGCNDSDALEGFNAPTFQIGLTLICASAQFAGSMHSVGAANSGGVDVGVAI